ncbi:hypothetical protein KUCAC02_032781 [Chaenocephalus aceratus]|nr:hypothetical protein KUCAC02_032781 [Chaenocephalus aceratus]
MEYKPSFSFQAGTSDLQLKASKEAVRVAKANSKRTAPRLTSNTRELAEAQAALRVSLLGGNPADRWQLLSQTELQFGQYRGQTFQWLLSQDLGYTATILAGHQGEREGGDVSSTPLMWNKDALLEYAGLFTAVMAAVRRKRAPGTAAENDQLVGFGVFTAMTYREMYESVEKEPRTYRKWLRQQSVRRPGSQLAQLKDYIDRRDKEKQPVASSAASAAATSSAASAPPPPQLHQQPPPPQLSPPPPHLPPQQRRKRKLAVLSSSEDEDDHLMVEAAAQVEAALAAPAGSLRSSLPAEQHEWVSRALFVADRAGRPVLSPELQLWHLPPGPWPKYSQRPYPDAFFQRPFFLWVPYKRWKYHLKCPNCAHKMTGGGLYKTVRRVLDMDGWYYMGTEYLECSSCSKKCASWSASIRKQLDLDHQMLFPAVLTYRLSCDRKVLAQMKGRTLGNSASRLRSFLVEQHTAEWMRRSIHYLNTCRKFLVAGVNMPPPQLPPQMVPVPSCGWLLSTYVLESFTRIEEMKAKVTSTFGSILKMDSTKKKLAGADAGTALWMSSVGNELGQVLMSVLTAAEGYGLRDMTRGLQERYQLAGKEPPQVLYVDRDCCRRDGGTCAAAALFPAWPHLLVRLDIWHFIRRLAVGVTSESHPLYPEFMRRLSSCIFVWDAKDMSLLETALQADGSRRAPSSKEMGRHCRRRRTRGAQETERLLTEAVEAFKRATDTMNVPLLDQRRMEKILETQRQHIPCIQDPAGVRLYTRTGQLTRGGVSLPVYRCARGSTSLESFHLHLHRLLCEGDLLQMFLLEGLTRWNEDRAKAAAGAEGAGCYSGQEQYTLQQLTQQLFQITLVECYVKPLPYTGELIGISYLYNQTGKVLQALPEDPDEPDDSEEMTTAVNVRAPGYQQVRRLAHGLVEICEKGDITQEEVEVLVGLWQNLLDVDKDLVVYPSRYRAQLTQGRFKKSKTSTADSEAVPGLESMKRCMVGTGSGPCTWPDTSRLVGDIFILLCQLNPSSRTQCGFLRSRWTLVIMAYDQLRATVYSTRGGHRPRKRSSSPTGIHALQGRRTEEEALLEAEEPQAEEPRAEEPLPGPATVFMELSTNYNRRRLQKEQAEAARRGEGRRLRAPSQNKCSSCGLRKIKETGHRLLVKASGERVGYCPVLAEHKSPDEWLDGCERVVTESLQSRQRAGRQGILAGGDVLQTSSEQVPESDGSSRGRRADMTTTMDQTDLERAIAKWKASPASYRIPKRFKFCKPFWPPVLSKNPPRVCPGCSKDISVVEHLSLLGLTFCRATSGLTLDEWLKVNVPKTTGWRLQLKMASAAAGVFPPRRERTCTLCSQRTIRATGHSMHRPTRQSFCQVSDPQNRTVEQWLTELRGGKTEKEMLRDRQRVNRKKKKAATLNSEF